MSARTITRAASKQTYYTILLLADRDRVEDAFRSYAYLRWVDDVLDGDSSSIVARRSFLQRQKSLLEACYGGRTPRPETDQEQLLVELAHNDRTPGSGLQCFLRTMMQVMDFDCARRGRSVTLSELTSYTRGLALAVTENIHHFIGHGDEAPRDESRYMAVAAAHITHMLRDTFADVEAGYFNVPRELLETNRIGPGDVFSRPYRRWVRNRVALARRCFQAGKLYLTHVRSVRHRLAVLAYAARFEWLLNTFEREDYCLRPEYSERRSAGTLLSMGSTVLSSALGLMTATHPRGIASRGPFGEYDA